MPIQINGVNYLSRKDLADRGWELQDMQKLTHDEKAKLTAGRGRPTFLYLESKIVNMETDNPNLIANRGNKEFEVISKPGYNFVGSDTDTMVDKVMARLDARKCEVTGCTNTTEGSAICDGCLLRRMDEVNANDEDPAMAESARAQLEDNDLDSLLICSKPQAISEPKPTPSVFNGVQFGPKPQGLIQAVIVDEQGSETSVTL